MKKIEYYRFMEWDGGDCHVPKDPCFLNKADADAFLGDNRYDRFDRRTVYVYESLEEYTAVSEEKTRAAALAKLTDIEKKALGLI
jgi:hypothetical protein